MVTAEDKTIQSRMILDEATVRVEFMFYIPSLTSGVSQTNEFKDFCEDLPENRNHPLYVSIPALLNSLDENDFDPEFVCEDLMHSGVGGFIVQAATPVFKYHADGRSHHYSWGHYYTEWLHVPDEDSIATSLAVWAEGRHEGDRIAAIATGEQK